jgi:hypothetical protein
VATISDPDDAARGVAPIRQFHKCDESKILPHKRLGLAVSLKYTPYPFFFLPNVGSTTRKKHAY